MKLRKTLKILGFNVGVFLVGCIGIELVFGGWFSDNKGILVIPKDFSRRYDVSGLYPRAEPIINYHRDSYGLRGTYDDPADIDILTIGGSTTNEVFISEGETWSDNLGKRFSTPDRPVVVANAGVDGQSSIGLKKNFELWFPTIPGLKPAYVIAYMGSNDLAVLESGYMHKQDHLVAKKRVFKQYLLNNSALYTLFRNIRGMVIARRANVVHHTQSFDGVDWTAPRITPDVEAYEKDHRDDLDVHKDNVKALIATIDEFGAKPVIVTQQRGNYRIIGSHVLVRPGEAGDLDIKSYIGLTAVNRATLEACRESAKAICVDLASNINFGNGDHYDGLHTTPKGSAKVAGYLYQELKDTLKFTNTASPQ